MKPPFSNYSDEITPAKFPLSPALISLTGDRQNSKCLNKEKSKIYHLCHYDNQPGLSHERRLAAHVRPGDEHACALTVDRCLLVAVTILEKANGGK